jgi:hypothetical protein
VARLNEVVQFLWLLSFSVLRLSLLLLSFVMGAGNDPYYMFY